MLAGIMSDKPETQLDATMKFRKWVINSHISYVSVADGRLLSKEKNPPIDRVIESGVVPRFVQFLDSDNSILQFEAAWALTSMSALWVPRARLTNRHCIRYRRPHSGCDQRRRYPPFRPTPFLPGP